MRTSGIVTCFVTAHLTLGCAATPAEVGPTVDAWVDTTPIYLPRFSSDIRATVEAIGK